MGNNIVKQPQTKSCCAKYFCECKQQRIIVTSSRHNVLMENINYVANIIVEYEDLTDPKSDITCITFSLCDGKQSYVKTMEMSSNEIVSLQRALSMNAKDNNCSCAFVHDTMHFSTNSSGIFVGAKTQTFFLEKRQ